MARKLLINAQKPEELRIAILDGDHLEAYQVEVAEGGAKRGNIYRGIITNVQPSLNAAFVDFGDPKNGFLSMGDIVEDSWTRKPKKKDGRARIEDVIEKGKPILVQVSKDMEGKKGSALTTNISLAGRYLVYTPFDDKIGISRKVEDDDVRQKLREIADGLNLPSGNGLIIRTNALEQNKTTISRDYKALARLWKSVTADFKKSKKAEMLYNDQEIVIRALRDFVDAKISEVLVDTDEAFEIAKEYMRVSMPRSKTKLVRYSDREPLFSRFKLEQQVDGIYDRRVALKSGGSVVIDRTEALTAVDVNSGRSTRAGSQEETAFNTNIESAIEIARQLRLRDIGGLIVVDFIDMKSRKHRGAVEKELKEAMKVDRARHTIGRVSANGLVEINRQRIRKELHLQTHRPCPTCEGTGRIASVEMVGLNLLRRIEARAATSNLQSVRIELHPELADAVQNGRRQQITDLEREFGITVEIIASSHLHRPEQVIDWVESSEPHDALKKNEKKKNEKKKEKKEPRTEESDSDGSQPTESESGSKRRRRRKKKKANGDTPPASEEPVTTDDLNVMDWGDESKQTSESAVDSESNEKPRRSRRRKKTAKDEEASPAPETAVVEPASKDKGAGEAPAESDEVHKPRRPRRRRRSAKKSPAAASSTGSTEDAEPEQKAVASISEEDPKPPAKRRRRRSSSKRKAESKESEEAKPADTQTSPEGNESEAAPPVAPVARKRRPRRRPRRKPSTDSGQADAGVSSPSDES